MARINYVPPTKITDPEMRRWLETAIRNGRPGPENQAIRAHHPAVMRSFTMTRQWLAEEGVLEKELRELVRVRIATSLNCSY
jgi:alkylhydroperoxidase family enzyme